jgi:hypothetical protein
MHDFAAQLVVTIAHDSKHLALRVRRVLNELARAKCKLETHFFVVSQKQ